jgi:lambda family phage portal protein
MNRPTWFDRVYATVMPQRAQASARAAMQLAAARGLERSLEQLDGQAQATDLSQGGFDSTRDSSGWVGNWSHGVRDARGDTLPHARQLRGQARDLSRNNGLAAGAIESNVLRAMGTGLALSAQPQARVLGWSSERVREWAEHTQDEWRMFADSEACDWNGRLNFDAQCQLVTYAMLDSGDTFTILPDGKPTATMPYKLRLQVIEADRVGNPGNVMDTDTMCGGIKFDDGRPIAAHVYHRHPGSTVYSAKAALFAGDWYDFTGKSGRRRVLHHFKMTRPDQPRGVPYLAPLIAYFRQLGIFTDAEIKAAIVASFHTVFIESDTGASPSPIYDGPKAQGGSADAGVRGDEIELGPGAIIGLRKGEKANTSTPGRPSPQFGPFVQAVIDQLGAGSGLGGEMLLKKYNTSYTAARAAFLDAWKHILDLRMLIVRTFCQPVYETWLTEAVASGRIAAPGFFADPLMRWAYTRAHWQGDSQGSINPKDEVAAFIAAIDARLMTRERAEWELFGTSFGDTYDTKKAEHERLEADGMLPVPKAGAAAPPLDGAKPPAKEDDDEKGTAP